MTSPWPSSKIIDGKILCQGCFEVVTVEEMSPVKEEPGRIWDVCKVCDGIE